jgi:transcriptional regulator with XRE-family HTH domain
MRIKRLRADQGLTPEQLARKAKVSLGYHARLETGHHDPKLSTLLRIAKALGVPVTELLE